MDIEVIDFYTIGLPRSRSLWLSKLLSCGDSTCFHEHLSIHSGEIRPDVDTRYRGFCDTNPLISVDYGDSPVLIVKRPTEDVVRSGMSCFVKPDGVRSFYDFLTNYMGKYQASLDAIKPDHAMVVDFEDLNDPSLVSDICSFLMPGNPVSLGYIHEMMVTRVQTTNTDLTSSLKHTAESLGVSYKSLINQYDKPTYTCSRILDYELAMGTMDAMWEDISEDGAEQYKPDLINEYWVGIYAGGEYVGMYRIHQLTSVLWQGHTFTLPDKREHSFGAGKALMGWVVDNIPGIRKMIVEVPECFPNVLGFVKKLGFKEQGYNSDSYSKNGIVGVYQLGMTDSEMRDQVGICQQQ